jgi:hypothetical protein
MSDVSFVNGKEDQQFKKSFNPLQGLGKYLSVGTKDIKKLNIQETLNNLPAYPQVQDFQNVARMPSHQQPQYYQ